MVVKIIGEISLRKNMKCDCSEEFFISFERCHELIENTSSNEARKIHLLNYSDSGVMVPPVGF